MDAPTNTTNNVANTYFSYQINSSWKEPKVL